MGHMKCWRLRSTTVEGWFSCPYLNLFLFLWLGMSICLQTDRWTWWWFQYTPPPSKTSIAEGGGGMKIILIIRNACFEMYIYIKDLSYLVYIIHNMHTYMYKYRIICKIRYDCLMFYALYQLFWLSIIFHTIISSRIKQHIVTFF